MIRENPIRRRLPTFYVDNLQGTCYTHVETQVKSSGADKADVLRGTLVLLVLRTLEALGPLHGYAIARRIEQLSENLLQLNQGTIYPALLRLEQEGWISSRWGVSEKNRKAKYYSITAAGRRQLAKEADEWQRMSSTIARFLGPIQAPEGEGA